VNQFHVGRGATRGALTVFPIWAEVAHPVSYSMNHSLARIGERPDGPNVGSLTVSNAADIPLLLLEGQLLEGGMQHRMVAQSTLFAAHSELPLDVVCVEQVVIRDGGSTCGRNAERDVNQVGLSGV